MIHATATMDGPCVHAKCGEHELWWLWPVTDSSEPVDGTSDIPEPIGLAMFAAAKAVPL